MKRLFQPLHNFRVASNDVGGLFHQRQDDIALFVFELLNATGEAIFSLPITPNEEQDDSREWTKLPKQFKKFHDINPPC